MKPDNWPTRNVALLQETMAHIEKNPTQHNQNHWMTECGTAFCYAGHAAILAGATTPGREVVSWGHYWGVNTRTLESRGISSFDVGKNDMQVVDEFATAQLGITDDEAEALFDGDQTVQSLRLLVDALCADAWIDENGQMHDVKDGDGNTLNYVYVTEWFDILGVTVP